MERAAPVNGIYVIDDLRCTVTGPLDTMRAGDDADEVRWVTRGELERLACVDLLLETLAGWSVLDELSPDDCAAAPEGTAAHVRGAEGQAFSASASPSDSLAAALMSWATTLSTDDSTMALAFSSALRISTAPGSETSATMPE